MSFYISILFLIIVILLASERIADKKTGRRLAALFSFIVLFCISAFRDITVGGDLQRYLPTYYGVASRTWSQVFTDYGTIWWTSEPGFRVIQKLMSNISTSDYFYIFFTSAIVLGLIFYSIYKYSENIYISIYTYASLMYTNSFNIIRASISVGLCLLAYKYIKERKLLAYTLIILVAFSIQKTSLLFFPAYFLYNLKYHPMLYVYIMVANLGLSYAISGSTIVSLVENYAIIFDIESTSEYLSGKSSGLTAMGAFLTIFTFALMKYYRDIKTKDPLYEFFITMMVVASIVQYYSSVFQLLNRVSLFYYSYFVFCLPYFYYTNKVSKSRYIFLSVIFMLFFVQYYSGLNFDGNKIVPYRFSFDLINLSN